MSMFNTLDELLAHGGVDPAGYDLALIGDGSGGSWKQPAGWSCVLIDRQAGLRQVFAGGASHGTIGWAELEPYLTAIRWDFHERQGGRLQYARRVVVFSDSQSTVRIGRGEFTPKANLDLWGCVGYWQSRGYQFRWVWVERNQNPLHVLTDRLSRTGELYRELCDVEDLYSLLPG